MSAAVPPRGTSAPLSPPGALAPPGAPLDSEDALKRVFFAEYAALTTEAHAALGDPNSPLTTKVVEGSFVRAWDARATLLTMDQLEKFLIDDVHHASARALSRRVAAHRFAGHAAATAHTIKPTSPEESWAHVQHALHGEEHTPQILAEVAKASRHEAAGHISRIAKGGNVWVAILVGALVLGGAFGAVALMNRAASKGKELRAVNSTEVRQVASPAGRTGDVQLTDGSTAHMAPSTKLTIPNAFGPQLRAVKVEGAVTFDVAPNLEQQLHVFARDVAVIATGTSFTVSSFPSDSGVTIVVGEGSVEVRRGEEVLPVAAGAGVVALAGSPLRAATEQEREDAAGWRTGTLAITNKPLRNALELISRWYKFDIRLPDTTLNSRPVTLRVSLDSSMQAITAVEKSAGLKFGYIGPNMVFRDTADKRTK